MTEHDPWFTEDDSVELVGLEAEEDGACPGCGQPLVESTDENYEYTYRVDTIKCIPCAEKAEWIKEQFGKEGAPAGTYVNITEDERVPEAHE